MTETPSQDSQIEVSTQLPSQDSQASTKATQGVETATQDTDSTTETEEEEAESHKDNKQVKKMVKVNTLGHTSMVYANWEDAFDDTSDEGEEETLKDGMERCNVDKCTSIINTKTDKYVYTTDGDNYCLKCFTKDTKSFINLHGSEGKVWTMFPSLKTFLPHPYLDLDDDENNINKYLSGEDYDEALKRGSKYKEGHISSTDEDEEENDKQDETSTQDSMEGLADILNVCESTTNDLEDNTETPHVKKAEENQPCTNEKADEPNNKKSGVKRKAGERRPEDVLGVPPLSSPGVIRKQYHKLAKKWHPDKNLSNKKQANEKMTAINEAYKTLLYKTRFWKGLFPENDK